VRLEVTRKNQVKVLGLLKDFFKDSKCDKVTVVLEDLKLTRSQIQNNLYWSWVRIFGKELGYTVEETHLLLKDKFLGRDEFTSRTGTEVSQIRSSRKLKVKDFSELLEHIDRLAAEYGITLPRGEEYNIAMGLKNE
jgi:hypothetical protein